MRSPAVLLASVLLAVSLAAAPKTAWVLNLGGLHDPRSWAEQGVGIEFDSSGDLLLSFFRCASGCRPITYRPATFPPATAFVAVLLAGSDGHVIRKNEWPLVREIDSGPQFRHRSRLRALVGGGFIGVIGNRIEILDSSFKVLRERCLDCEYQDLDHFYSVVSARAGQLAMLDRMSWTEPGDHHHTEVVDVRTLTAVDAWDATSVRLESLRDDRVLAVRRANRPSTPSPVGVPAPYQPDEIIEKRVGSPWQQTGLKLNSGYQARFVGDDEIVWTGNRGAAQCWAVIAGARATGNPVCYADGEADFISTRPADNAPIIAVHLSSLHNLRAALDFTKGTLSWVVVHDLSTGRRLLVTRKRYDERDYALSSDGRYLAVLTEKKLEVYAVPGPSHSKK